MGLHESVMKDEHECQIRITLDDGLKKVPPQEPSYKKWIEKLKKVIAISEGNPKTREVFNGTAGIIAEKQRHNKYNEEHTVIHPLSMFMLCKERFLIFLWMLAFFKNPFTCAFLSQGGESPPDAWRLFDIIVDVLLFIDIIINFYAGYEEFHPYRIVLAKKEIVCNYLKTFFIFEFLGTIPCRELIRFSRNQIPHYIYTCLVSMRMLRFVRLPTMMEYIRQWSHVYNLSAAYVHLICQSIMTFCFVHWMACIAYIIPNFANDITGEFPQTSWITVAQLEIKTSNVLSRYLNCVLCIVCHFFGAGTGMYLSNYIPEQLFLSLVLTMGFMYSIYLTGVLMLIFSSLNIAENKYEEMLYELEEYMRMKKISPQLRGRMIMYYKSKFRQRYFKETKILGTLSEHLRLELFLYQCRSLIYSVNLFQGMSRSVIGVIFGLMTAELYITNDVIAKFGDPNHRVWFIAYGTVAIYHEDGTEVRHLQDGDYFGATIFDTKNREDHYTYTVVAVDTTEVFSLSKRDFHRIGLKYRDFRKRLNMFSKQFKSTFRQSVEQRDEAYKRKNILLELKRGRILEKLIERTMLREGQSDNQNQATSSS